jgi:hypothetical protein
MPDNRQPQSKEAIVTPSEREKSRQAEAYAKGLCVACKDVPHRDGAKTCQVCSDKAAERTRLRRLGISSRKTPAKFSVGDAAELTEAEYGAARRELAKRKGFCSICTGNKARRGLDTCARCGRVEE